MTSFNLPANALLPLGSHPSHAVLREGRAALYTVNLENGQPTGARHFLFACGPQEVIPNVLPDPNAKRAIVVLTLSPASGDVLAGGPPAGQGILPWVAKWAPALAAIAPPASAGIADPGHQTCPEGDTRILHATGYLQVTEGTIHLWGLEACSLDATHGPLPVPEGTWWTAATAAVVERQDSPAAGDVDRALSLWHRLAGRALDHLGMVEQQADQARYVRRTARDAAGLQASLQHLATLLNRRTAVPPGVADPLQAAMAIVGRPLGITVKPPSRSEGPEADPVEAIARASRCRIRQVFLEGTWWQTDHGPLLAFRKDDQAPLALLPDRHGGYRWIDPTNGHTDRITPDQAATLAPDAVMLYRTFDDQPLTSRRLLAFALIGQKREAVLVVVMGLAATLLGMITPYVTGELIDSAIPDSDRSLILQMGGALAASALGVGFFSICRSFLLLRVESLADSMLQAAAWDRVLKLVVPFFRAYDAGDLNTRLMAIGEIRQRLSGVAIQTLFSAVMALLNLVLLFIYSPALAGIALIMGVVAAVVVGGSLQLRTRHSVALREKLGANFGFLVQLISGVSKLRVSAAEGRGFSRWAQGFRETQGSAQAVRRIENALLLFNEALTPLCTLVIFGVAASWLDMAIQDGRGLTTGAFLAFNSAFGTFMSGLTDLGRSVVNVGEATVLWRRSEPLLTAASEDREDRTDPGRLRGAITLDRISFRYRQDGPLILRDVSLEAAPGEQIALVGPSGCGKSTVFRMLLGFETPESGSVYIDGQDLAKVNVRAVRSQIGVVLQNVRLQAGSIFENIAAGARISQEDAWAAAAGAGLDDDIRQMPMGMYTVVSEGGGNLSGGQRQRLILARAFARNPRILLLDEATSALDSVTQATVSAYLERQNATRIVIAHRLSTIRTADRIYVFEAGRVVQVGTFAELASQPGPFATLVARQLA